MSQSPNDMTYELLELASRLPLRFPLQDREEFVDQMAASGRTIGFQGREYDSTAVARLMPSFFFPVSDLGDLLKKSSELLLSRGMLSESQCLFLGRVAGAIDGLCADLATQIRGATAADRLHAMDVLTHALDLTNDAGALDAWRAALHRSEAQPTAVSALRTLIAYLFSEQSKGQSHAAINVCQCLAPIVAAADSLSDR